MCTLRIGPTEDEVMRAVTAALRSMVAGPAGADASLVRTGT